MAMALQVHRAAPAPSTPRANKRQRLSRQDSDDKENLPAGRLQVAPLAALKKELPCKDRFPLQPLQLQAQQGRCAALAASPTISPYPLVGREQECGALDSFLQKSLTNGAGNGKCLYISGGPGTGKTCSVRASINEWKKRVPDTHVIQVNCMDLTQRSVPGVLQRLLHKIGGPRVAGRSMQGLAEIVAATLSKLGARIVIVVDEIDQLISRSGGRAALGAMSLETLFSLPRLPGAPAVAIVAIANAVDLLERTTAVSVGLNCGTLLFEAYSKDQLKSIVTSRVKEVEGGEQALKALGSVKVELRIRQVAKECGDCRQVLSLIEEAVFEAKSACEAAASSTWSPSSDPNAPDAARDAKREAKPMSRSSRNDPLQAIQQLPLEQQILLAALASSKKEATKISDVCSRYKELSRALRQPANLGSRGQLGSALSALEQRGLLEMRCPRAVGRGPLKVAVTEATVELSVSCCALREHIVRAVPLLEAYMD